MKKDLFMWSVAGCLVLGAHQAQAARWDYNLTASNRTLPPPEELLRPATPEYKVKDYSSLKGMEGFSDKALENHFKLYEGYVRNTNIILSELARMSKANEQGHPAFQELRRRVGWEFDGMRLHELYFENLGATTALGDNFPLYKALVRDFGSYDAWLKDFIATGKMRGIGWVVLYEDPLNGRLLNTWINEHDVGHLAGGMPLLVMDVFEHAYMTDYGIDRGGYLDAFVKNIKWETVNKRFGEGTNQRQIEPDR